MYQEIEKRCKEILAQCGENSDLLEVVKLAYITALIDAGIIHLNKSTPA